MVTVCLILMDVMDMECDIYSRKDQLLLECYYVMTHDGFDSDDFMITT